VSILQARPLAENNDFASPSTYTLVKDSSQLLVSGTGGRTASRCEPYRRQHSQLL
jgi:hypothetical protein